jgi:predicted O-linked N-acetylglucosamine transferase (SPINDLY family)
VPAPGTRRVARRLVFGFRAATARIHAPVFWRALYAALERGTAVRVAARMSVLLARLQRTSSVELLSRVLPLFETGWPHHLDTPWNNLEVQRFYWRIVRELQGNRRAGQRPPRRDADGPLRIGVLGLLDGAFYFTRQFFEAKPRGASVVAFDLGSGTPVAGSYVAPLVESYRHFSLSQIDELGGAINDAELDVLLADVRKPQIYELLDLVTTPCVAFLCAEVQLRYHPSVSFHLYPFQQADYILCNDRLFCATSRSFSGDELVYPAFMPYDRRGLDPSRRRRWEARENVILFHGRLFKASQPFVEVILELLREDEKLQFVMMGADSQGALARIRASARRAGVESRVSYEGPYETLHDEHGDLADPSWERLFELLGLARLAPDPWPFPGATTRMEAYAAGAPTAHMGVRTDRASWGRPQHTTTFNHFPLEIPRATAYSTGAYREICQRVLYEEAFAEAIAEEQAELVLRISDPGAFWRQLLDCYDHWLATRSL